MSLKAGATQAVPSAHLGLGHEHGAHHSAAAAQLCSTASSAIAVLRSALAAAFKATCVNKRLLKRTQRKAEMPP